MELFSSPIPEKDQCNAHYVHVSRLEEGEQGGLTSRVHGQQFYVLRVTKQIISSTDLQYTCTQSRILAVQVSRSSLQSRFTEQFFSTL